MANHLVIVESPAKVKTIKKFLGSNYEVDASGGHVRDLPKSQLGFDPEHDYEPKYITIRGKGDVLAKLRKEVKKADKIYLATDPDREGEAISWHLMKALKLDELKNKQVYRISFNEITKNAVKASLKSPRDLDMNLVNAQQTRRMLDRMVGYRISPLLWAKVKRGLSAGRVQSVALRMICDREDEINAFIPEEYWNLDAMLNVAGSKKPLDAKYYGLANEKGAKGSKSAIHSKEELDVILKDLEGVSYVADEVKKGERIKKAPIPFTTSTLQQEASKALNFSTQKTMRIAQQLYEGVEVKGHGTIGLITYLRTDSTRVADEADAAARSFVKEHYGENYAAAGEASAKNTGKIQDAHEAIRPTDITLTPVMVKESLPRDLFRLYQLIWKRFTASRMAPAVYETTSVKIRAGKHMFTTSASRLSFDGFMSVYVASDDEEEKKQVIGAIESGMELKLADLQPSQHFTQPPAHYTEASLVKAMEEQGIGPSLFAVLLPRFRVASSRSRASPYDKKSPGSPFCASTTGAPGDFLSHGSCLTRIVFYAAFEDFQILLAVNVDGYGIATAFGVGHLAQNTSVRAGNSFNGHVGAIGIPEFIHSRIALIIYILRGNLSVSKQSFQPLPICYKTSLTMRSRIAVYTAQLCLLQPRGLVGNNLGIYHLGNMAANGVHRQSRRICPLLYNLSFRNQSQFNQCLETVTDT